MKKILIALAAIAGLLVPAIASASLQQFFATQGQKLPSLASRASIAVDCGIVVAPASYTGTVAQNSALERCLTKNVPYWVKRIQNNATNPLTDAELQQVPDEAWKAVTPVLIQVLSKPADDESVGGTEPTVTQQIVCRGMACDEFLNKSEIVGFNVATGYKTTLGQAMTSVQTTVPVSSMSVLDGTRLTVGGLGGKVFLTVEPGATREEITKCTDNTVTLWSSCLRGLAFSGNTSESASTTLAKSHNTGSIVVMSNVHYVYEQLVDVDSSQTIRGDKTFVSSTVFATTTFTVLPNSITTTPSAPGDLITLNYLSTVTSTGCSNASQTVRGCVEEATSTEFGATGGTGARLFLGTQISTTSAAAGTTTRGFVVRTRLTDSKIDSSFGNTSSSIATTDSNNLVVQNPASATGTPGANLIPLGNASGTIPAWMLGFAGDGSLGALSVVSGTTTISASSNALAVFNYTSLNIATNTVLAFSNPSSTVGTLVLFKVQGDCNISGTISVANMGATSSANGWGILDDLTNHAGTNGNGGNTGSPPAIAQGGATGTIYSNLFLYTTPDANRVVRKSIFLAVGSGGGSGGDSGNASGANGRGSQGGRGGGAFLLQCAGTLSYSGNVILDGQDGIAGVSNNGSGTGGGGGGGGGAAGMGALLANKISLNTGTFSARGGKGGDGGAITAGLNSGSGGGAGGGSAGCYDHAGYRGGRGIGEGGGEAGAASTACEGGGGGGGAGDDTNTGGAGGARSATGSLNSFIVALNTSF